MVNAKGGVTSYGSHKSPLQSNINASGNVPENVVNAGVSSKGGKLSITSEDKFIDRPAIMSPTSQHKDY